MLIHRKVYFLHTNIQQRISHVDFFKIRNGTLPANVRENFLLSMKDIKMLRWSRGSVLDFSTQDCGFKPGGSRRIFRAKKSSARLPSEGK
jgi:hypothetical protein